MKKCSLWGLLAVAGCDEAFDLSHVTLPEMADALPLDAFVPALNCPLAYSTELVPGGSRYRILPDSRTAAMQHALCAADSTGVAGLTTHLAVIDSPVEAAAIEALLNASDNYAWYVGAVQPKDQAAPSTGWVWVTGEPVEPGVWSDGEPNDFLGSSENNEENLGYLQKDRTGLVDGLPTSAFPAICECDGRPIDQAAAEALATSS